MSKATWIKFEMRAPVPGRKTKAWYVRAIQGNEILGQVKWWSGWRRYCYFPMEGTVYEQDCLRDIAAFCEKMTFEHRQAKVA